MDIKEYFAQWKKENPKWGIADYAAALVKKTRLDAGLTQYELAKKMHTKQESIARAEKVSPKHTASLIFLERVAKACGKELKLPEII